MLRVAVVARDGDGLLAPVEHAVELPPEHLPDEYRNYAESEGLSYPDLGANTDWQDVIFRAALSQNHNVSFGGGSKNSSYRASFGYNSQEGIIESSKIQKYTARLNGNQTAMDGKS